ncbi:SDR family NAD(P)-dependent oxidoreductase [Kineococcus rhizosphaerae]|uniref:NAD(P)-dependent dehydrogenase (Short-subunit alcohol dehydrogenase family) n=1 Tax=Kineococcus rhizosphaerae TaxID=559628 RepID=A0A2T0QXG4_9ACTN|nr:SDR family NAD(P)-dependent oxidoreductase [Kineococcus rhizosphaerae]PRY10507.1 NAD(P)-dependent dehydrogenase (short-subunit alcohol dehydrogenase family) [Kineococcus rhizosphaerae]
MSAPVVLVTGAAGGIGRATVQGFAAAGYDVAAVDVRRDDSLAGLAPGRRVVPYAVDVTDDAAVARLATDVERDFGRLDSLALVAGINQGAAPVDQMDPVDFRRVLDVNLVGPFLLCHHLVPLLRRDGGGTIGAVSSFWARSGHAYFGAYCASKAGLLLLVQSLADELAPDVRVNSVCPGNIDTRMHREALESEAAERGISVQEMQDVEWGKIPLKAAGSPQVIADALVFLASERAAYVTGASLDVNGGVVFH